MSVTMSGIAGLPSGIRASWRACQPRRPVAIAVVVSLHLAGCALLPFGGNGTPDYMLKLAPEVRDWVASNPQGTTDLWIMLDLDPEIDEIWRPVAHFTPRPDEIARRNDLQRQIAETYRPVEGRTEQDARAARSRLNAAFLAVNGPIYARKRALRQEASARAAELDRELGARAFAALRETKGVDPSTLTDDYPVSHGLLEVRATSSAIVAMAQLPLIARIEAAATTGTPGLHFSSQAIQVDPNTRSNANNGERAVVAVLDTGVGATAPGTLATAGDAVPINGADCPPDEADHWRAVSMADCSTAPAQQLGG